jgi:hypothetical protein
MNAYYKDVFEAMVERGYLERVNGDYLILPKIYELIFYQLEHVAWNRFCNDLDNASKKHHDAIWRVEEMLQELDRKPTGGVDAG